MRPAPELSEGQPEGKKHHKGKVESVACGIFGQNTKKWAT
jgi:hypothetical protein